MQVVKEFLTSANIVKICLTQGKFMFFSWTLVSNGKSFLTPEIISDSRKVCKNL